MKWDDTESGADEDGMSLGCLIILIVVMLLVIVTYACLNIQWLEGVP